MAQHVILNHPDLAFDAEAPARESEEWAPRTKFLCLTACVLGSWLLVLAPFFLIG